MELTPVNIAINEKHENVIDAILSNESCVHHCVLPSKDCLTKLGIPLHRACRLGYNNVVELLLKHENITPELRKQQLLATSLYSEYTPLHQAALKGHSATVKLLIKLCKEETDLRPEDLLSKETYKGNKPIHSAIIGGSLESSCFSACNTEYRGGTWDEALVQRSVKVILEDCHKCIRWKSSTMGTPFYTACYYGRYDIVRYLAECGASVYEPHTPSDETDSANSSNDQCKRGDGHSEGATNSLVKTPLMVACLMGHTYVVKFLLDLVEIEPKDLIMAIKGGSEETAAMLILHHGERWKSLLRDSCDGTTPFQELIKHMPNVAKLVLDKSITVEDGIPVFYYEFIEGYEVDKTNDSTNKGLPTQPNYQKDSLPLSTMVKFKRVDLLTHPVVASRIHYKLKKFGWISLLHWILYLFHITIITILVLGLPRSDVSECNGLNCSQTLNFSAAINLSKSMNGEVFCHEHGTASIAFAVWALIYSTFRLILKTFRFGFAIHYTIRQIKRTKEFNHVKISLNFVRNVVNLADIMELLLIALTLAYGIAVLSSVDHCPHQSVSQLGAAMIFLSWLELTIMSTQFKLVGVYALMLVRVLKSFLTVFILLGLMVTAFGLPLYLSLSSTVKTPANNKSIGYTVLSLISTITGQNLEEFVNAPFTFFLFLIFVIVMVVLFTNLLIGLAVGDIQTIYDTAKFQEIALQVDFILDVECSFRQIRHFCKLMNQHCPSLRRRRTTYIPERTEETGDTKDEVERMKSTNNKSSLCEMFINSVVVLLWGGESFDSKESNDKVLKLHQSFLNSTKYVFAYRVMPATHDDVNELKEEIKKMKAEIKI